MILNVVRFFLFFVSCVKLYRHDAKIVLTTNTKRVLKVPYLKLSDEERAAAAAFAAAGGVVSMTLGADDGTIDGVLDGLANGDRLGSGVGSVVGSDVGSIVEDVGDSVIGAKDGISDGAIVGEPIGAHVLETVHASVTSYPTHNGVNNSNRAGSLNCAAKAHLPPVVILP